MITWARGSRSAAAAVIAPARHLLLGPRVVDGEEPDAVVVDPVGPAVAGPPERHRGYRPTRRPPPCTTARCGPAIAIHGTPATASPLRPSPSAIAVDADASWPALRRTQLEQPLAGRVGGDLRRDLRRGRDRDAVAHDGHRPPTVGGDEHGVLVALVAQPSVRHAGRPPGVDLDVLARGVAAGGRAARRTTRRTRRRRAPRHHSSGSAGSTSTPSPPRPRSHRIGAVDEGDALVVGGGLAGQRAIRPLQPRAAGRARGAGRRARSRPRPAASPPSRTAASARSSTRAASGPRCSRSAGTCSISDAARTRSAPSSGPAPSSSRPACAIRASAWALDVSSTPP